MIRVTARTWWPGPWWNPSKKKSTTPSAPTRNIVTCSTNYEISVNNPDDPTYPQFLGYCDDFYKAQFFHTLTVETTTKNTNIIYRVAGAKLSDVAGAVQSGLSVKYEADSNDVIVTKPVQSQELTFKTSDFTNNGPPPVNRLYYPAYQTRFGSDATNRLGEADERVFTNDFKQSLAFANDFRAGKYTLKMRTFEAVLYGLAKEQAAFKRLAESPRPAPSCRHHLSTRCLWHHRLCLPARPHPVCGPRPILTIQYGDKERAQLTQTDRSHPRQRHVCHRRFDRQRGGPGSAARQNE